MAEKQSAPGGPGQQQPPSKPTPPRSQPRPPRPPSPSPDRLSDEQVGRVIADEGHSTTWAESAALAREVQESRRRIGKLEDALTRMEAACRRRDETIARLSVPWRTRGDDGQEYKVVDIVWRSVPPVAILRPIPEPGSGPEGGPQTDG